MILVLVIIEIITKGINLEMYFYANYMFYNHSISNILLDYYLDDIPNAEGEGVFKKEVRIIIKLNDGTTFGYSKIFSLKKSKRFLSKGTDTSFYSVSFGHYDYVNEYIGDDFSIDKSEPELILMCLNDLKVNNLSSL